MAEGMIQPDVIAAARIRAELRVAVVDCRERGLHHAAKWAAEQLQGVQVDGSGPGPSSRGGQAPTSSAPAPEPDSDQYQLAKTLFDVRDYRRAAHALHGTRGPKALFLRCYALYLAGEKRRDEERVEQVIIRGPRLMLCASFRCSRTI